MNLHYTRYGIRELILIISITLLLVAGLWLLFPGMGIPLGIVISVGIIACGFIVSLFFRNPERTIPSNPADILAPADGRIVDIERLEPGSLPGFGNEAIMRIGIFLSLFNTHINRAPCRMNVRDTEYRRGMHVDARNQESSGKNENCTIHGTAETSQRAFPLAVRQISGAVARRIVCAAVPGDILEQGQIFGMIKFGSRTEIYLPEGMLKLIRVRIGDKVEAGLTPLASLYEE